MEILDRNQILAGNCKRREKNDDGAEVRFSLPGLRQGMTQTRLRSVSDG